MKKRVFAFLIVVSLLSGCGTFSLTLQTAPSPPAESVDTAATALLEDTEISPSPSADTAEASPSPEVSEEPLYKPMTWPVIVSKELNQVLASYTDFYGSVLIEKDGEVLLYMSYGLSDVDEGMLNKPVTKYLIGSVTKQFTAMAIMQLYEKGLLDINDTLSEYIPDFPRGEEMTLVDLLRHTSGIVDYMNDAPAVVDEMAYDTLSEENILDIIKTMDLKFDPGSKYSYCNTNYLILGCIVEWVSGQSYADYLSENIFEVVGMKNTGVFDIDNPPDNIAAGHWNASEPVRYYDENGEIITDNANATAAGYGAGGLYSTVEDLYMWDQALQTDKLLSNEYLNMLFEPAVHVEGALIPSDYGFGWILQTDPDFGTIIEHTGTLGGFRAFNGMFTDRDITVIILYNNKEFAGRSSLLSDVKQALLDM